MNYAITIDSTGRITGRHHSTDDVAPLLQRTGLYDDQEIRSISPDAKYAAGFLLAEYDDQGQLRPLLDRVLEGLTPVTEGMELIDGQLVETAVPEQEAPPTLMARVQAAEAKAADAEHKALTAHALEAQASRAVYTVMLANGTITDAVASTLPTLAPQMVYTGKSIPANTRIQWDYGEGPVVVKAKVTLWDREDQNPANAPTLWDVLQFKDGHRIIPEVITAELAFGKGEIGYWPADGKFYKAKRAGVVHTPAVYPADWEEVDP